MTDTNDELVLSEPTQKQRGVGGWGTVVGHI